MTRANRERKKKKRIDIAKCMYDLPMFDSHFEPVVSEMQKAFYSSLRTVSGCSQCEFKHS